MNRRALLVALALTLPPALVLSPLPVGDREVLRSGIAVREAGAAVSIMLSLEEMVAASSFVVVATAGERHSVWEQLPSGRKIVTYTKLTVEQSVRGAPGAEVWVRTLGGVVDKIGQAVSGEAQIAHGTRSLLFLTKVNGVVVVTGMAQGHYPVVVNAKSDAILRASPDAGTLLPRSGPAVSARERLLGATVDDGVRAIKQAAQALNDRKK